jgi:hypothetical protein
MGRSGTITRVLSLCGGALPKRLLGANESNPTGHWEPLDSLNLNDGFLQRYGSNWYDPRLPQPGESAFDSIEGRAFIDQVAGSLDEYLDESLLVIKEPRITALQPSGSRPHVAWGFCSRLWSPFAIRLKWRLLSEHGTAFQSNWQIRCGSNTAGSPSNRVRFHECSSSIRAC